eukprot:Blabericola_migrator_1__6126@NODE_3094_length_2041_cov_46_725431_g1936_i0_p3_GENE_NODE_3094_length_2041_cov_46_725431_g1936_i0NODE_3094_length_2041_cov_46_725431_g1936_i0_p3_ORF_typecomplete_len131_score18_14_NODE_3094_length_2041_cov_46_725431_g1936_i016392031
MPDPTTAVNRGIKFRLEPPSQQTARLLPPATKPPTLVQPEGERPYGNVPVMASDAMDPFNQLQELDDFFNFPLPPITNDFTPASFASDPYEKGFITNRKTESLTTYLFTPCSCRHTWAHQNSKDPTSSHT